jgi:putative adhesin
VVFSVTQFFERYRLWPRLAVVLMAGMQLAQAQSASEFQRTLEISVTDPVRLDVTLSRGDLQIVYGRDGELSIAVVPEVSAGGQDEKIPHDVPTISQDGNQVVIRQNPESATSDPHSKLLYRIVVPYRTEVHSAVGNGKQTITGVMGPVEAVSTRGDIKVSYISKGVTAKAASGNVETEVIGERVEAQTGSGNISCLRAAQGATVETADGDITLMVVGPSAATVKKGTGRIEAGGVRGTLTASTDAGDLHIKALPHDDWNLKSVAGNIRVELPQAIGFEIDATSGSGELAVRHDDIEKPAVAARHLHQRVNGGGKLIELRTDSGKIVIG